MDRSLFSGSLSVELPILAWTALALLAALSAVAVARRDYAFGLTAAVGAALFMLAAASPAWVAQHPPRIVALADVSPSTRGATFRDFAQLRARLRELTGRDDVPILRFADGILAGSTTALEDVPTDRTKLILRADLDADVFLVFTDGIGTFDRGASTARLVAVVDPELLQPNDGRIESAQRLDDRVVLSVRSPARRALKLNDESIDLTGDARIERIATGDVVATLDARDRWPENDSATLPAPLARATERFWIGPDAPAGWTQMNALPADLARAAVVVLNNVPADAVEADRLASYVRDFGGGLVIVGGDRSLGAGGYVGTPLDALSPLVSSPPVPTRRWVYLVDASGSMSAAAADGRSRLATALDAVGRSTRRLPVADRYDLATFARTLTWHLRGERQARAPSAIDVGATGPTNLRVALDTVVNFAEGDMPTEVVLLTDGAADLGDIASLRDALKAKRVTVHLLALAPLAADAPLRSIATTVGSPESPGDWTRDLQSLVGRATAIPPETTPIDIAPWSIRIAMWNRTWARDSATTLARAGDQPMAATWNVGLGRVTTVAFAASREIVERLARDAAATPRDPAIDVDWQRDRVRVTARNADGAPSNGRRFELQRDDRVTAFDQVAPGEYEAALARTSRPTIAQIVEGDRLIDVAPLPTDHAQEFDRVGVDVTALRRFADHIVLSEERGALTLPTRERRVALATPTACAGATLLVLALIARVRGRPHRPA